MRVKVSTDIVKMVRSRVHISIDHAVCLRKSTHVHCLGEERFLMGHQCLHMQTALLLVQVRSGHVHMEDFQVTIVTHHASLQITISIVVHYRGEVAYLMAHQCLLITVHMETAIVKEERATMARLPEAISTHHVRIIITGMVATDGIVVTTTTRTITDVSFLGEEVSLMVHPSSLIIAQMDHVIARQEHVTMATSTEATSTVHVITITAAMAVTVVEITAIKAVRPHGDRL